MPAGKFARSLVAACAALALLGAAHAQRVGHTPAPGENTTGLSQGLGEDSTKRLNDGIEALRAKNFLVAESAFEDVLRHNKTNPDANFMMGVTKMSMGKWEDAKTYLEIAVRKNPKGPDPKSRLAVTYIKLGDLDGAKKQRTELAKLDAACKGACRDAKWIADGIAMVDAAMPAKP